MISQKVTKFVPILCLCEIPHSLVSSPKFPRQYALNSGSSLD
jgi:hypothetical protein